MTGYLPRGTQVGDKLRLCLYALNHSTASEMAPKALTGQVIYIHPQRRFATVRFPLTGYDGTGHKVDKGFCEAWLMPVQSLTKRGIEIKYKKGLTFVQAAQARKAAAGSSSPDSGK